MTQISDIEHLIGSGRYFEAHNQAEAYCREHPNDLRGQQLCGLAMSKSGARLEAIAYLEPILEQNSNDSETAGILGSVYKEQFKMTAETPYAIKSLSTYQQNFNATQSYYTGINAASMSQILGKGRNAREIATRVAEIAIKDSNFWALATMGEAYLLLKDFENAAKYYELAANSPDCSLGGMASVHGQLLILEQYIRVPGKIMRLFTPATAVVFAGHMIDVDRPTPRFPNQIVDQVKQAIKEEIKTNNYQIGYCSLACGADILFAESMLELGGELNIYLPFNRKDFLRTSVSKGGDEWVKRFEAIEKTQHLVYLTQGSYDNADTHFHFLGKSMIGAVIMRSSLLHNNPHLLTVASESNSSSLKGGTNDIVSLWPYHQNHVNINPDKYLSSTQNQHNESADNPVNNGPSKEIRYLVQITMESTPENTLLDLIRSELTQFPGKGKYRVENNLIHALYTSANYAIAFALRLLDWCRTDEFNATVALETVLSETGYKLEDLTIQLSPLADVAFPGTCYATMQFANALSAEHPKRFDYNHVGILKGNSNQAYEIYKIDRKIETALS